ncbi:MAG: protein-glutamate O-methyltransferase [Nitrospirota bacterium]|nr:protein-glutamate O-methyltransferase [Nitrospirota bacterium]
MEKTMEDAINRNMQPAEMSQEDFRRISEFVQKELGIMMPPAKRIMVQSRLQKRLRALRMSSYKQYCEYVFSPRGIEGELVHMIDLVTTNKTDFFREPAHFEYLISTAVPELARLTGAGAGKQLMIWSAGCSTGEEPYTLAMVLQDYAEKSLPRKFAYTILATDISTKVLNIAQKGIYSVDRITPVPMEFRKKFLLRSRDREKGLVMFNREIREIIRFRRLNFMDEDFGFREPLDIIFCRNVIIYFDRNTQKKLFNQFYRHMTPGGYLFTGHSETLNGLDVPFTRVGTAVYRKPL